MSELIYQVEGLRRCYGERCVLDIASMAVQRGEVLGLVGPSGAGKSTLLRLLNFLEPPTSGRVCFEGEWYTRPETVPLAVRRRAVMVFQRPMLLSGSVQSNVAYGLRLRGVKDVAPRVQAALERVGLLPLAQAAVRTLSGGELQRVTLARALVVEPDVLLLDEPTANLDPAHVARIEAIVREANRTQGTTIIIVTHNIFQARRLAHRVGLLVSGRLAELAPTAEFFERPRSAQARAFISGEMVY